MLVTFTYCCNIIADLWSGGSSLTKKHTTECQRDAYNECNSRQLPERRGCTLTPGINDKRHHTTVVGESIGDVQTRHTLTGLEAMSYW
jgi:hypothetical protein